MPGVSMRKLELLHIQSVEVQQRDELRVQRRVGRNQLWVLFTRSFVMVYNVIDAQTLMHTENVKNRTAKWCRIYSNRIKWSYEYNIIL